MHCHVVNLQQHLLGAEVYTLFFARALIACGCEVTLHARTYYFDRLNPGDVTNAAWALGGWLGYSLGLFSGQGKNRFAAEKAPGFLYLARVAVRPFGAFDEEQEGDLARLDRPRLAVGAAVPARVGCGAVAWACGLAHAASSTIRQASAVAARKR